ncbi:DUF3987 domain-containing protein [Elizabethkingia anophelis]|uniref:DUF3987 domain-containing protein n=1 Tax=Elizabethkingia anophelis TaxID=1117645 RepID=UPI001EE6EFEA|nr:DUF3987 domain-containing protein [Elizabethkingia anophelis]UKY87386.1 DUF3987 domain-containing protein [Elizabethkingia anophelis]UKZ01496.1 DUF3987 domain-containing protein [Elizabethkingia anophelis]
MVNSSNNPYIPEKVYKNLPEILKEVADNFSGREKDIVLTSTLAALGCAIPNVYGMYGGNEVFPQLYVAIIAPPASGKGSMMKSQLIIQKIHNVIVGKEANWGEFQSDEVTSETKEESDKKEKKTDKPDYKLKIVPANISSAQLLYYMNKVNDGMLMIESEADTLGIMIKQDWGNYSDILRKAFHHEPVSLSRKGDDTYIVVEKPKLSLAISGTPLQLKPIINQSENGLLSRFIVYTFSEISSFKNVFSNEGKGINNNLNKIAEKVLDIYNKLKQRQSSLEFELTPNQIERFLKYFEDKHNTSVRNEPEGFISNIHRLGLIFFRVAMIIAVYRAPDTLYNANKLYISNKDFILCIRLLNIYFEHSLFNFREIDIYGNISENELKLLNSLPDEFTTENVINKAEELGYSKRSIHYKLSNWKKSRIINKIKNGKYQKNF